MKIYFALFVCIQLFILINIPSLSTAQTDRAGNHCAVQKSPFRVSMDSGKVVYSNQCLSCHQANGEGIPGINPPLNGKGVTGDKTKLIGIIIHGQDTHEELNGKKYQQSMPANSTIKDQEVADVLTYIRNSFGNKASSVKATDVKSARKKLNKIE
ncbi:MAG TPA: cytochrome c [Puia sp.]|jgi:mono/diheme cytochrome c family protein|nr:cytochrome c [Puia sp.]